jgi:diguanylate cyclase (GGDEF)-like protein/PAS domain S-box-containing protein/putative nucleotidyltransferase with HDIG domain
MDISDNYKRNNETERSEKSVKIKEDSLINLVISNADGMIVIDRNQRVRFVNPAAEMLFEEKSGNFINRTIDIPFQLSRATEHVVNKKNGERAVLELRAVETIWEGETAFLLSLRDITSRKRVEDLLRKSEERYELAVRGSQDGLWDWNIVTNEIYYSPRWKSMLGYEDCEIGSESIEWFKRVHPEDSKIIKDSIDEFINVSSQNYEKEYRMLHKNGSFLWVLCRGVAKRDENGKALRIAGVQSDITQRKTADCHLGDAMNDLKFALASEKVLLEELDKRNKELIELSLTDGLTGLYNHRFIQERFEFEFKRIKRYGGHLSCMMIDIDHFKLINDTYGHQFGDYVLREIAKIIQSKSREVDICARYGGEEFMIVTNVVLEYAMIFATKLHAAIEKHTFEYDGKIAHVTISIGLSDYRDDMKSRHEVIEHADEALYQAKEDGRNLIRIWKENKVVNGIAIDHFSVQELKTKFVSLSMQMRASYMDYTNALIKAVDAKDPFTKEHSHNVAGYSVAIAKEMGMPQQEIDIIKYASLLHDIGKISVPQEILIKTDPLTPEEYCVLQKHPVVGVSIVKDIKFMEKEIPIILHHHERFDGKGYPNGLMGREIPLGARIIAAADAYDAMTSGRGYKGKLSPLEAQEELKKGSGSQFSPEIVGFFISVLEGGKV